MTTAVARWRATYLPGEWLVLSGPTAVVALSPSPDDAAGIAALWDEVVASASIGDVAARLAPLGLGESTSFAVLFWAGDGMRSLVRGAVRVLDDASGQVVADGEGIQTWNEIGLGGLTRVRLDLQTGTADVAALPLVVGAVRAGRLTLDAGPGATVESPQAAQAAGEAGPTDESHPAEDQAAAAVLPIPLAEAPIGDADTGASDLESAPAAIEAGSDGSLAALEASADAAGGDAGAVAGPPETSSAEPGQPQTPPEEDAAGTDGTDSSDAAGSDGHDAGGDASDADGSGADGSGAGLGAAVAGAAVAGVAGAAAAGAIAAVGGAAGAGVAAAGAEAAGAVGAAGGVAFGYGLPMSRVHSGYGQPVARRSGGFGSPATPEPRELAEPTPVQPAAEPPAPASPESSADAGTLPPTPPGATAPGSGPSDEVQWGFWGGDASSGAPGAAIPTTPPPDPALAGAPPVVPEPAGRPGPDLEGPATELLTNPFADEPAGVQDPPTAAMPGMPPALPPDMASTLPPDMASTLPPTAVAPDVPAAPPGPVQGPPGLVQPPPTLAMSVPSPSAADSLENADTQLIAPVPAATPPPRDAAQESVIMAVVCPYGHVNPPNASACRVCGSPIAPQAPQLTPRPSLALLRASDGTTAAVDRAVLIGRAPSGERSTVRSPRLMTVPSPGHDISRTHVEVAPSGWQITVTDLHSTNGTVLVRPGGADRSQLPPGEPVPVQLGSVLELGDGVSVLIDVPQ